MDQKSTLGKSGDSQSGRAEMKFRVQIGVGILSLLLSSSAFAAADSHVCKAAIAAIMGRDFQSIIVDGVKAGVVSLRYTRKSDNTLWKYRCKIRGSQVLWASETGRWRDGPLDEKITFEANSRNINIIQRFEDGSLDRQEFPLP